MTSSKLSGYSESGFARGFFAGEARPRFLVATVVFLAERRACFLLAMGASSASCYDAAEHIGVVAVIVAELNSAT
jgi:hypothetical protein